ncbi:MAG: hypothetical protein Ct9H300mP23_10050 [Nitrospinota bacterium]|nr:MAG: hypothetical protein Ct9H300mP23_10050 [Nitrospinota bacterium]
MNTRRIFGYRPGRSQFQQITARLPLSQAIKKSPIQNQSLGLKVLFQIGVANPEPFKYQESKGLPPQKW